MIFLQLPILTLGRQISRLSCLSLILTLQVGVVNLGGPVKSPLSVYCAASFITAAKEAYVSFLRIYKP